MIQYIISQNNAQAYKAKTIHAQPFDTTDVSTEPSQTPGYSIETN